MKLTESSKDIAYVMDRIVLALNWEINLRPDIEVIKLRSNHHFLEGLTSRQIFDAIEKLEYINGLLHLQDNVTFGDLVVFYITVDKTYLSRWAQEVDLESENLNIWRYKDLVINLKTCTLSYLNETINISPSRDEILFLLLLIQNSEQVVSYDTIAAELDINSFNNGKNINKPTSPGDNIKVKKQKLVQYLLEMNLSADAVNAINKMIKAKSRIGYKLQG